MKARLLCNYSKPTANEVKDYLVTHFERAHPPDILISYLHPKVVSKKVLSQTKLWNINFHPGPPEYPGIGCYNFALKDDVKTYGVTAHIMEPKVDTGKIIKVKRFDVLPTDTVYSLSIKSYGHMYVMFLELMDYILKWGEVPYSSEEWKRPAYTRKELNELCDASEPDDRWVKYP